MSDSHFSGDMLRCSNTTRGPEEITLYVYYYGCLYLITVVNLVGNGLVLSTWFRYTRLRCPANYFIFSLAVSDIILGGVFYPIYNISHMEVPAILTAFNRWAVCWAILLVVMTSLTASSFNLVLLTFNRYLAVVKPHLVPRLFSWKRSLIVVILLWIFSFVLAITVYIPWQSGTFCGVCRYELFVRRHSVVLLSVITVFLPLSAMITMYAHLSCITRRQVLRISTDASLQGPEYSILRARMARKNMALAKMAAMLVGYFALSWLPLVIFLLISTFCQQCESNLPAVFRATFRLVLHSNSAVNVFIYAGRHPDFREVFSRDFGRLCCCASRRCQKPEVEVTCGAAPPPTAELKTMSQLEAVHNA